MDILGAISYAAFVLLEDRRTEVTTVAPEHRIRNAQSRGAGTPYYPRRNTNLRQP